MRCASAYARDHRSALTHKHLLSQQPLVELPTTDYGSAKRILVSCDTHAINLVLPLRPSLPSSWFANGIDFTMNSP
jgi:hypothetical protein